MKSRKEEEWRLRKGNKPGNDSGQSGTAEATRPAIGYSQLLRGSGGFPVRNDLLFQENLRNPVTVLYDKILIGMIHKDDLKLATVIGVYGTRRIQAGYAMV